MRALRTFLFFSSILCTSVFGQLTEPAVWIGQNASANYFDAQNWQNSVIPNEINAWAYITNTPLTQLSITNDLTLGYLCMNAPSSADLSVVSDPGKTLTLAGSNSVIRTDNRRVNFYMPLAGTNGVYKTGTAYFYPYSEVCLTGVTTVAQGTIGLDFRTYARSADTLVSNMLPSTMLLFTQNGGQLRMGGRPTRATSQTFSCTLTAGNPRILCTQSGNLSAGQLISSADNAFPEGTYIKAIIGTATVELSNAALLSGNYSLTFLAKTFSTVQRFDTISLAASGSLYVGGDNAKMEIGALSGRNGLTLDSAMGTSTNTFVEIHDTRNFLAPLTLNNGVGVNLPQQRTAPTNAPVSGPIFHVDASRSSTLTLVNGTDVDKWQDVNGTLTTAGGSIRWAQGTGRTGMLRPKLLTNALNGRPVVDFGTAGSRYCMIFNDTLSTVRTAFLVLGSQNGGGIPLGTKDTGVALFQRGMDPVVNKGKWEATGKTYVVPLTKNHALFWDLDASHKAWINSEQIDYQISGLSGDYDIVSVALSTAISGREITAFCANNVVSYPDRSGGARLAEVILYDKVLTDQERRDTEAYLAKKWFNRDMPGYGAPRLPILNAFGSANWVRSDSAALSIGQLTVTNSLVLPVNTEVKMVRSTLSGTLNLAGGRLQVENYTVPATPPAGVTLHADATTGIVASGDKVTRWNHASGGSHYAYADTGCEPTLVAAGLNNKPIVDFGLNGSKLYMKWETNVVFRSFFWVAQQLGNNTEPIGAWMPMMGAASHFYRGVATVWNPGVNQTTRTGVSYLSERQVDPLFATMPTTQFALYGQVLAASSIANGFACGAYDAANNLRPERTGGLKLAEMLIYERKLSEREALDAQAYLNWKWFNTASIGYAAPDGSVYIQAVTNSLATTEGELILTGTAPVRIGSYGGNVKITTAVPVTIEGGSYTATSLDTAYFQGFADLVLADQTTLTTDLPAVLAVTGALTVNGTGNLNVTFPNTDYPGDYPLIQFGSIDGASAARLTQWTVSGVPARYRSSLVIQNNQLVLRVSTSGTIMLIQ